MTTKMRSLKTLSALTFGLTAFVGWRALSQDAEHSRAVGEAAIEANIVKDAASPAIHTFAIGFDPGAPLDAIQRMLFLAWAAPLGKGGEAMIEPEQLCTFLRSLNDDPTFKADLDWQASRILYRPLVSYFLGDFDTNPKNCGKGVLKGLRVSRDPKNPNGRRVELLFTQGHMEQQVPALGRTYFADAVPDGRGSYKATLLLNDNFVEGTNFLNFFMQNQVKHKAMAVFTVPASDYERRFKNAPEALDLKKLNEARAKFRAAVNSPKASQASLEKAVKEYFNATSEETSRVLGRKALESFAGGGGGTILNVRGDEGGGTLTMKNPTGIPGLDVKAMLSRMTVYLPPANSAQKSMIMVGEGKALDAGVGGKTFQSGYGGKTSGK